MGLANLWNNIIQWFSDRDQRNDLVRDFNNNAKYAFINGVAPTCLKASISKGDSSYRHEFSKIRYTGFRIQALSGGRQLTRGEMKTIGEVILADQALVRRLVVLGWDTLEVHDQTCTYGLKWKLIDYAQIYMLE